MNLPNQTTVLHVSTGDVVDDDPDYKFAALQTHRLTTPWRIGSGNHGAGDSEPDHSTVSDGTGTPSELMRAAAGLDVIALTSQGETT